MFWEAEAGGSLELRRLRLQWTMIMPLHSSLNDKVRHSLKKRKRKKDRKARKRERRRERRVDHLRLEVRNQTGQHGEILYLLKIQKISWVWWHRPVIPATWEAEAEELLKPGRQRLQWAEIMPLHSSLGNKSETLSQKKRTAKLLP